MKFKIIFISFNILIVFSFLMIFLLPVFMLGGDYALQFWQSSWWVAVIFMIILIFVNVLYFMNRKILGYLETENWTELKVLLEQKIFQQNSVRKMYIRMYISTCIASSAINDLMLLENKFRQEDPKAMEAWALALGLPYLLKNDPAQMKAYYGEFLELNTADAGWIKWNYCFSLLLQKETDEAIVILKLLATEKKDVLLQLSALYMLSPFTGDESVAQIIETGKTELKTGMTKALFAKELEKQKDNVQMLFLTKIFNEAADWLYEEQV